MGLSLFHTISVLGQDTLQLRLSPNITFQTIANFGASDAWSCQEIGTWSENIKNEIAELLFSKEYDESGSPKGIGLSCWRFNIGAGSAEQAEGSNIKDPWRRAESFIDADGNYDWTKQQGQQWFVQQAVNYRVEDLVAFVNSPPVYFTKNGKAYSDGGGQVNLKPEAYDNYARFLSEVIQYFQSKNILFDYLSPFNEPQWDWKCCKQEGSPWLNDEVARFARVLDKELTAMKTKCKIEFTESAQLDFLYKEDDRFPTRSNHIDEFFYPSSTNYIGDLKSVARKISGHGYFTTWDSIKLVDTRIKLNEKLDEYSNLDFWMSEYCVLENNKLIKGTGIDLGMTTALYVANVIHTDLTVANASAWHWWLAVSKYNFKDGLIYIEDIQRKTYQTSKTLWGLGNYSRFVRPGMQRVNTSVSDQALSVSGFKDKETIVLIIINPKESDFEIRLPQLYSLEGIYVTDANRNLEFIVADEIIIAPKSISTILLSINS